MRGMYGRKLENITIVRRLVNGKCGVSLEIRWRCCKFWWCAFFFVTSEQGNKNLPARSLLPTPVAHHPCQTATNEIQSPLHRRRHHAGRQRFPSRSEIPWTCPNNGPSALGFDVSPLPVVVPPGGQFHLVVELERNCGQKHPC